MTDSNTTNPANTLTAEQQQTQLDKIKAMFAEEEGGSPNNDDAGGSPNGEAGGSQQNAEPKGEPKGKPTKFNDLAERLGVELDDLYKLEVAASKDGSPITVEMLKDAHAKQDDLTVRELAFEERVSKREAELTRAQTEMTELMSQLDPKAITPQVREKIRAKVEASQARERELILETIPEWRDEKVREPELAGMVEHLKDYGISEHFLSATMNHKLFRMVRDAYRLKQRVSKALAGVEGVKKPSTTGKSKPTGAPASKPGTQQKPATYQSPRDRVLSILR